MTYTARHNARARFATIIGAATLISAAAAVGCSSDKIFEPANGEASLSTPTEFEVLGRPVPIEFETYEKSRQVVHPSAVSFPSQWHGQRLWLALTPYPNGDSHVENPSLYGSTTGDDWRVPDGITNPVATTTRGYLSDPDLAYDPTTDELRLYYREVVELHRGKDRPMHRSDVFYLTRSGDGRTWSAPQAVVTVQGHFAVSPTVARRADGDWKMWAVDAGRRGCTAKQTHISLRRSVDGVTWSVPVHVAFAQPGYLPWHLDVQWVPEMGAYWALVAAYPAGTACTASSLFLATSVDGVNWTTYASPVLARGALPQFATNVYRSTFAFEPNGRMTIWLTGASTVKRGEHRKAPVLRWSAAVWHTHSQALLEHVRIARTAAAAIDTQPSFLQRMATANALP